jgi:predicted CoA-binding protein
MPTVAVVGASAREDRPSYLALLRYRERGYTVWPVTPAAERIAGMTAYGDLAALPGAPDLISMYVNPARGMAMLEAIVACRPRALWLNPGADGAELAAALRARGVSVVEGCSLVALAIGDPLQQLR